jgi:hypothetical protein
VDVVSHSPARDAPPHLGELDPRGLAGFKKVARGENVLPDPAPHVHESIGGGDVDVFVGQDRQQRVHRDLSVRALGAPQRLAPVHRREAVHLPFVGVDGPGIQASEEAADDGELAARLRAEAARPAVVVVVGMEARRGGRSREGSGRWRTRRRRWHAWYRRSGGGTLRRGHGEASRGGRKDRHVMLHLIDRGLDRGETHAHRELRPTVQETRRVGEKEHA